MKKIYRIFELLIWLACGCCFLLLPQSAAKGAATGLRVCAASILPSLFPFFILSDYWIQAGYADALSRLFAPLMQKFFHLPGNAASALVLGSIGGYPVGARTAAQLYSHQQLTKEQAEQMLYFCNNAGPAFVLGVMGHGVFQNIRIGILLFVIHLVSAYFIGFLFRPKECSFTQENNYRQKQLTNVSQRFTSSITSAGSTAILVCTYVLFFAILTECLHSFLPAGFISSILTGVLELAGGANMLASTSISAAGKFILCAAFLGFGGFCVLMQSASVLQSAGLSVKRLLAGKLFHGFLSAILAGLLSILMPTPLPCAFTPIKPFFPIIQHIALLLLLIFFALIFLKESSGKVEKNRI